MSEARAACARRVRAPRCLRVLHRLRATSTYAKVALTAAEHQEVPDVVVELRAIIVINT